MEEERVEAAKKTTQAEKKYKIKAKVISAKKEKQFRLKIVKVIRARPEGSRNEGGVRRIVKIKRSKGESKLITYYTRPTRFESTENTNSNSNLDLVGNASCSQCKYVVVNSEESSSNLAPIGNSNIVFNKHVQATLHIKVSSNGNESVGGNTEKEFILTNLRWVCKECTSSNAETLAFNYYPLYKSHKINVHSSKYALHKCEYCDHITTRITTMVFHEYIKHEIKPVTAYLFLKCARCPHLTLSKCLLAKHYSYHTLENKQCSECYLTFENDEKLELHRKNFLHAMLNMSKPNFQCVYCYIIFSTATHLFSHIKAHHRDMGRNDGIVAIDELDADELSELDMNIFRNDDIRRTIRAKMVKLETEARAEVEPTNDDILAVPGPSGTQ